MSVLGVSGPAPATGLRRVESLAPWLLYLPVADDDGGGLRDLQLASYNRAAERLFAGHALVACARAWAGLEDVGLWQRVWQTGEPHRAEVRLVRPGGGEVALEATLCRDGDGVALWLREPDAGLVRERAARRAAEERAAYSGAQAAHLRMALAAAHMCAWDWTRETRTLAWSDGAERLFGLASAPQLGDTLEAFLEHVLEEDRAEVAARLAHLSRAAGSYSFRFRSEWSDGSLHHYEVCGETYRDAAGEVSGLAGVVMDCTEREQRGRALREAEERYRLAARATHDVLWDWDLATHQVRWNDACEQLFGFPASQVGHTLEWWTEQIHPDDRDRAVETLRQNLLGGSDGWSEEYRFRRKDGSYIWVLDRGIVMRGPHGGPVRMIGSMMDITDRKRAVERMREEAQFRERFIGILGHDLRNPLNAIALAARALKRKTQAAQGALPLLERIEASTQRMGNMISEILDLTRARLANGIPLLRTRVRLGAVCRGVVEELATAHPGRDITLAVEGEDAGQWDADRLAQVLSNLVGNALEHSPGGAAVAVRLKDLGDAQLVEVSNPGEPIPADALPTLFDPFRQAHSPREQGRRSSGLGLGLFIVREIVQAHGGGVEVSSTPEGGTTFSVVLPREPRPDGAAEPPPALSPPPAPVLEGLRS